MSRTSVFFTAYQPIVDTGRLQLYDSSWVFTAEAQLGYDLQLTRNISVILENGYGYDTAPERGNLRWQHPRHQQQR